MLRRGENVRATVIGSDETKSPLLVEHLNFASRHESLLGFKIAGDFRADPALFSNRSSRPKDARPKGKKGKILVCPGPGRYCGFPCCAHVKSLHPTTATER